MADEVTQQPSDQTTKTPEEKPEEKKQNGWAIKGTLLDIINKLKPNKNGTQTKEGRRFFIF